MTNFCQSSVLKGIVALSLAALCGCGVRDGLSDLQAARTALDERDFVRAVKAAEKSIACVSTNVDAFVVLTQAQLALGEIDAAEKSLGPAVRMAPDDVDVLLLSGQVAYYRKDYAGATEAYRRLIANRELPAELRSRAWTEQGVVELTRNAQDAARVALLTALRLDRRNATAYYHLGLLYRNAFGYYEAAQEQFEKFVYLGDAADARVQKAQRGYLSELKDTIARNTSALPNATKRDSKVCGDLLEKADATMRKGGMKSFREARALYQKAIIADALSYPAALGLAKAWQKTDTTKEGLGKALEMYRQACVLKPSSVQTFLAAGEIAMRLGYSMQAVDIYSRAVAAAPTNLSAIDGLIRALRKVGGKAKTAQLYQAYRDLISVPKTH